MAIEPIFYTTIESGYEKVELTGSPFEDALRKPKPNDRVKDLFDDETIQKISYFFNKIAAPIPDDYGQFLKGTEGVLVASSKYALVTRIELTKPGVGLKPGVRIDNSGYILKPLISVNAGSAIIEVCPGIVIENVYKRHNALSTQLKETNINLWDNYNQIENTGRIPVNTPNFPDGITVVLDRLAVNLLSEEVNPIKTALEKEAETAQDELYSPLRKAFKNAWELGKTKELWELCRHYVSQGKLVAGWDSDTLPEKYDELDQRLDRDIYRKTLQVEYTASKYDAKLGCR